MIIPKVYYPAFGGELFRPRCRISQRKDNVISVKVLKKSDAVQIIVQDNGRGIKADKLGPEIQQILANRQLENSENKEKRTSIGIINIHERFLLFFGGRYSIAVESGRK